MEYLLQLDKALFVWINSTCSNSIFDLLLVPFRHKLFWVPLYLFLVSFIMLNYGKKALIILGIIAAMMATSDGLSSQLIKKNVKRIRPCNNTEVHHIARIHCSSGYSFTSSHATNHFAIGSFFCFLFSFFRWRILFLVWAGIISFAQVYVGVHYPLDILAGSILGIIIGTTFYKLLEIGILQRTQTA